MPSSASCLVRPDREEELGAGGDQDQLRLPVLGVGDDVAAAPHALAEA